MPRPTPAAAHPTSPPPAPPVPPPTDAGTHQADASRSPPPHHPPPQYAGHGPADYLADLAFWKRHGSVPPWKQGVKLYQSFKQRSQGRIIARTLTDEQIEPEQGFDLIVEAINKHFKNVLEAEPEVLAELAVYVTQRDSRQTYLEYTNNIKRKLAEFEAAIKEEIPPKIKGFIIKRQARLTSDHEKHLHAHGIPRLQTADKTVETLCSLDQKYQLVNDTVKERYA